MPSRSSSSTAVESIISGLPGMIGIGKESCLKPAHTLPLPPYIAAVAANTKAPLMPSAPPISASVPYVPLWLSSARGRNTSGKQRAVSAKGSR